MITQVEAPFLGANDKTARLISMLKISGARVNTGEVLCQLETTKVIIDVEATTAGYFYTLLSEQSQIAAGQLIAIISDSPLMDYHSMIEEIVLASQKNTQPNETRQFTKKAEILALRNNLNIEKLGQELGKKIMEQDVKDYLARKALQSQRMGFQAIERIGIIGGVSGGGAMIIIDAILRIAHMQAVAVFDQDPSYVGNNIFGVPVVGSADELLHQYMKEGKIDKVIIGFNRNLQQREDVFNRFYKQGIPFCNIVDPTVEIRNHVKLGIGNILLSKVYIGPGTELGDNNFVTAGSHIEHGNRVGSHCAFGPAVATSGNVTIGDRVRFAAGIVVEPGVIIGNNSVIASGAVLVTDVPENHVVKLSYSQRVSHRNQ